MPAPARSDEPTAGDTTSGDLLPLLLEICEDIFVSADGPARSQIDAVLQNNGITGGPGWLIDMLALTRQRLLPPSQPGSARSR